MKMAPSIITATTIKYLLNEANFDLKVNFLIYEEISPKGRKKTFSWVTDIPLSEHTLAIVMKGGRARWLRG